MVGNSVKSRAVTYDLISRFRGLLGGELPAYTELLSSASAEATSRLMEEAEMLGAGAVVRVRYQTSATADPASGIYCYVMCYVRACAPCWCCCCHCSYVLKRSSGCLRLCRALRSDAKETPSLWRRSPPTPLPTRAPPARSSDLSHTHTTPHIAIAYARPISIAAVSFSTEAKRPTDRPTDRERAPTLDPMTRCSLELELELSPCNLYIRCNIHGARRRPSTRPMTIDQSQIVIVLCAAVSSSSSSSCSSPPSVSCLPIVLPAPAFQPSTLLGPRSSSVSLSLSLSVSLSLLAYNTIGSGRVCIDCDDAA